SVAFNPTSAATFSAPANVIKLTDNNLNVSAATQSLGLSGVGTPIALTISGLTVNSKTYDRTTAAALNGTPVLVGVPVGDQANVSLSGTAVANGITVTVSGLSLTGPHAANYSLTQPTLSANITRASLTVTGLAASNKTY